MSTAPLLVELFTEELPPKALETLGRVFAQELVAALSRHQLVVGDASATRAYATPRRLAVHVPAVRARAEDRAESKKLMPAKVAYTGDQPTDALRKRLEKEGVAADTAQLERRIEGGAEFVYLHRTLAGLSLADGLQSAITDALAKLPIPKVMGYQLADGETTVHFVRPAHGLVALHGADIVPVSVLGLTSGRLTHGHRFQGNRDIALAHADEYETRLESEGCVIADFHRRRSDIRTQLDAEAARLGASLGPEESVIPLLDEVTALVERPTVYVGEFEPEFLAVPQECLILTMRQNQKYFPLFESTGTRAGKLSHRFLIVSNMRLADPRNIVEGNQRVVRPRLADARFFFETDKKVRLESRVSKLESIVYHNKLGSQFQRIERLEKLAGKIAHTLGLDATLAERAAWLVKADLTSSMVGEFPELQGIMGRYYALADGEPAEVADAIEDHYRPRYAGDALPAGTIACVVALADKLDSLAGLFGIGQQPTGDRDPFGLRRAALGVIRLLGEKSIAAPLNEMIDAAFSGFHGVAGFGDARSDLTLFIFDRMRGYFIDQGFSVHEVDAVLCLLPGRVDLVRKRLDAVRSFNQLPQAASLAAANKRIGNILRQAGDAVPAEFNSDRFVLAEESALGLAFTELQPEIERDFANTEYTAGLKKLAGLRSLVDAYFDKVMVMDPDLALRANRIAFLGKLHASMNRIADLSRLAA